jgi:predicted helicase
MVGVDGACSTYGRVNERKPIFFNIFGTHETAENNSISDLLDKTLWETATGRLRKETEIL